MFEDSLIESSGRLKTQRGWTTVVSVLMQVMLVGILVLIPLIYTEALPTQMITTFLVAPPPPPPPPPPPAEVKITKVETELDNGALRTPTKIPDKIKIIKEEEAPPQVASGVIGGVMGSVPGGAMNGVIGGIIGSTANIPKVAVNRIRVSGGVIEGNLIHKLIPVYPPTAKAARIQGEVILAAVIGKDGSIQGLHVISGNPFLSQAALQAVQQWKYKPYILDGEPVEVDTTIKVVFNLGG